MGAQSSAADIATATTVSRTISLPKGVKPAGIFVSVSGAQGPIFVTAYVGDKDLTPVFSLGGPHGGWVRSDVLDTGSDSLNFQYPRGILPTSNWELVVGARNDTGATVTMQYGISWED